MPKRFYLATRKDRAKEADEISETLKKHGWERTLTWKSEENRDAEDHSRIAVDEMDAIRKADVLIVSFPAGRGTHVEIGIALALGKRIILHAPSREVLDDPYPCPFHYHPNMKIVISERFDASALLPHLTT
jgi:nucleoside 2-deoxyribosyltransferase